MFHSFHNNLDVVVVNSVLLNIFVKAHAIGIFFLKKMGEPLQQLINRS